MEHLLSLTLYHHHHLLLLVLLLPCLILAHDPPAASCRSMCGSMQVKWPFGTGPGCGSPRFHPYVTCTTTTTISSPSPSSSSSTGRKESTTETLMLTTHTGHYPITSISYDTYTITLTPPAMSTCSSMQPSPSNFGLDWPGPFQPGPSTFILLGCRPPTSSLSAANSSPLCDANSHLCASLCTCPAVVSLGLPILPPTNTCCVYSPANLDDDDELDLKGMKCEGFASVVSLGDYATDPGRWEYGVALKYNGGVLESSVEETKCKSCEMSDGVCGYSTENHNEDINDSFVCVCKSGFNTTTDCQSGNYGQDEDLFWGDDSASFRLSSWKIWHGILAGMIISIAA
ncbi:hypothetical protein L484_022145 [Morus notabilis]|uniref:Wall-associated receptor kinase galacturonan-binding domain-containing protein n=1 Tax=Morus notabilis TaxID=981085 RepID=W9QKT2_9ROSA|nr:uncharacterized protein LOC21404967 [Morus notabilis]EXB29473.1 hypothetical protein L484_022145 [Morus notabilis]